jgi:hypothetical protein
VSTRPSDWGFGFVTDEREEAVFPLDWQAKAYNLVRILSVFLSQDADRDAVIHACCDGPIGEELAWVVAVIFFLGIQHPPGTIVLSDDLAIGIPVLLGGANAQDIRHPLRLEDALELRDQLDAVGLQLAEADFLVDMILEPLEASDMFWAVKSTNRYRIHEHLPVEDLNAALA